MTENAFTIIEEDLTDRATWALNSLLEAGDDDLAADLAAELSAELVSEYRPAA